jgi:hypothetical protein
MTTTEYPFLKRWSLPSCYAGASWDQYYSSGVGQSRDSKPLERANFDAMLKALGGEQTSDEVDDNHDNALVKVVRESHWAVGWVEWIAIHETATDALDIANRFMEKLEDYPVIDEDLWSRYEDDEAQAVWKDCYRPKERIAYIRKHASQFEFRSFADMLGCIRGNYFAGYASELIG